MEKQTHKLQIKKKKKKEAVDELGQNQRERKENSGSTWTNTKGRSHPCSGENSGRKKNTKTNLAYFKVSLEINAEQGQL